MTNKKESLELLPFWFFTLHTLNGSTKHNTYGKFNWKITLPNYTHKNFMCLDNQSCSEIVITWQSGSRGVTHSQWLQPRQLHLPAKGEKPINHFLLLRHPLNTLWCWVNPSRHVYRWRSWQWRWWIDGGVQRHRAWTWTRIACWSFRRADKLLLHKASEVHINNVLKMVCRRYLILELVLKYDHNR